MLEITTLKKEHLADAAQLVSSRYRQLHEQVPYLPDRYVEVETLLPLLQGILKVTGSGVAAFQGNQLVGFLTGWQMDSFRGKKSTYSPEWANAAELEHSAHIYEKLYTQLAADWVADGYAAHYISLFPNDTTALNAWNWMGFGMIAVDALRSLDEIESKDANVHIRRAEPSDLELVIELHEALRQYARQAPIFLLTEKEEHSYYAEWLQNPEKVVWLAYLEDEPVAFMRLGPADEQVATIIYDQHTTSIYSAFTQEKVRRAGIATALLNHAFESARASGYVRCAVSFEPMNWLGTRFWLRNFQMVCASVVRFVDERLNQE